MWWSYNSSNQYTTNRLKGLFSSDTNRKSTFHLYRVRFSQSKRMPWRRETDDRDGGPGAGKTRKLFCSGSLDLARKKKKNNCVHFAMLASNVYHQARTRMYIEWQIVCAECSLDGQGRSKISCVLMTVVDTEFIYIYTGYCTVNMVRCTPFDTDRAADIRVGYHRHSNDENWREIHCTGTMSCCMYTVVVRKRSVPSTSRAADASVSELYRALLRNAAQ